MKSDATGNFEAEAFVWPTIFLRLRLNLIREIFISDCQFGDQPLWSTNKIMTCVSLAFRSTISENILYSPFLIKKERNNEKGKRMKTVFHMRDCQQKLRFYDISLSKNSLTFYKKK